MAKAKGSKIVESLREGKAKVLSLIEAVTLGKADLPRTLTKDMAVKWIETASKGRIFGVNFTKRTTGTLRVMTCRWGVRSHRKGGVLKFNPKAKRLVIVFDMRKNAYRCVPYEGIHALLVAGRLHKVV